MTYDNGVWLDLADQMIDQRSKQRPLVKRADEEDMRPIRFVVQIHQSGILGCRFFELSDEQFFALELLRGNRRWVDRRPCGFTLIAKPPCPKQISVPENSKNGFVNFI